MKYFYTFSVSVKFVNRLLLIGKSSLFQISKMLAFNEKHKLKGITCRALSGIIFSLTLGVMNFDWITLCCTLQSADA